VLSLTKRSRLAAAAVGCSLALSACGGGEDSASAENAEKLTGEIQIDGSSTVAPLSEAAAEGFQEEHSGVTVAVDISDASRPIKDKEAATCKTNGIEFQEITVANDGLAVVVNKDNPIECLTVDQLKKIWEPNSKVTNFKQVDPSFPDLEMKLFGPGTDSGTFDYFTDEINGEEGASRTDYQPSEDDNVIVSGVQGNKGGMGYFGLSYVEENSDALKAVKVDGGDGCVAPSQETVLDGSYKPLSRPLFIYASNKIVERPEGLAFLEYYIENSDSIAEQALYVPLSDEQRSEAESRLEALKS
jgi:phosphate transport system substrate-binding protein